MRNLEENIASFHAKLFMRDFFFASKLNFNFSFFRYPLLKFPINLNFYFLYPLDTLTSLFLSSWPLQPFMILVFVPQEFEFALPPSLNYNSVVIYSVTFPLHWRIFPVWVFLFKWGLLPVIDAELHCRATTQEWS